MRCALNKDQHLQLVIFDENEQAQDLATENAKKNTQELRAQSEANEKREVRIPPKIDLLVGLTSSE